MLNANEKAALLEQIAADILNKNICPDLAEKATNLVMGDGNADADIVFIGEAPGKNEDLQGLPFVGAAGKFLDEMLKSIGLERKDIYITNIVKYRPPNNRDPLPAEKKAFWPYLVRQLDVIRPKTVVTLGRHSMEYFLPEAKISVVHGHPKRIRLAFSQHLGAGDKGSDAMQGAVEKRTESYQEYDEGVSQTATQQSAEKVSSVTSSASEQAGMTFVILPLYHPAAALYNGGMRETLLDDFSAIPAILKQIKDNE